MHSRVDANDESIDTFLQIVKSTFSHSFFFLVFGLKGLNIMVQNHGVKIMKFEHADFVFKIIFICLELGKA